MEFASEMVIKATLLKMKIVEVPTTLSRDGRSRPPHLRPYRDGWRHLRFMLLFSPDWLFLYPGLVLMLAGILLGAQLLSSPVYIKGVGLSVDTLIYSVTMIEVGFQAILFALLSRAFAVQEGLFPAPPRRTRFDMIFNLERGIILGSFLIIAGLLLFLYAFTIWENARFGPLDVQKVTPIVIGSSICLSLGFEVILSSFLLSMLKLNVRTTSTMLLSGAELESEPEGVR